MPDPDFQITGIESGARGIVPLLHFNLSVTNAPRTEEIHTIVLQAQIQIQAPQRS